MHNAIIVSSAVEMIIAKVIEISQIHSQSIHSILAVGPLCLDISLYLIEFSQIIQTSRKKCLFRIISRYIVDQDEWPANEHCLYWNVHGFGYGASFRHP